MIDGIPNRPLFFSQKDMIESILTIINHIIMNHYSNTIDHINHHSPSSIMIKPSKGSYTQQPAMNLSAGQASEGKIARCAPRGRG